MGCGGQIVAIEGGVVLVVALAHNDHQIGAGGGTRVYPQCAHPLHQVLRFDAGDVEKVSGVQQSIERCIEDVHRHALGIAGVLVAQKIHHFPLFAHPGHQPHRQPAQGGRGHEIEAQGKSQPLHPPVAMYAQRAADAFPRRVAVASQKHVAQQNQGVNAQRAPQLHTLHTAHEELARLVGVGLQQEVEHRGRKVEIEPIEQERLDHRQHIGSHIEGTFQHRP